MLARTLSWPWMFALVLSASAIVHAESELRAEQDPPEVVQAREAFVDGARLASDMRWGDALERFEVSARLRPHAGTSYNIGICQRALRQYVRARQSFRRALAQNEAEDGGALAASMVTDVKAFLEEIDRVIASLDVTIEPASASVMVDGRPLERGAIRDGWVTMLAGTRPPGIGEPVPSGRFRLVLDPGPHVLVISREGFVDIVHRVAVNPSSREALPLVLERLPGTLRIESNELRAVVTVDDLDVGIAPVTLKRPPGRYHVVVRKKGFVTYDTHADLEAGERVDLRAVLSLEEMGLTQRWWFWTAVGAVVVGTAAGTYYATRPEPERPPLDGGGLGWTVRVP